MPQSTILDLGILQQKTPQKPFLSSPSFLPTLPTTTAMAAEVSASTPSINQKESTKKKRKQKPNKKSKVELAERVNALPWSQSLPEHDDPFAAAPLGPSGDLEGGFLSLEEIDESEYGFLIPETSISSNKSKKRTSQSVVEVSADGSGDASEEAVEKKVKKQKIKKKKKKSGKASELSVDDSTNVSVEEKETNDSEVLNEEAEVDETEFYAWNELRLHPLLMKSIYKIGFKEPTPIQKVCIPAAAHQGKDVIGAAETGSGKTLAFGLPILQRLLQEREKAEMSLTERANDVGKGVHGSALRALILTPTRELAIQVTDHLKAVTKMTNIRAVAIVGGMSTEKQERLLKTRPEIVVGTPGRLWELMSGGDQHLVELHSLSFFVLDEADRMIQSGHFQELQSIIDMLPMPSSSGHNEVTQNCVTVSNVQLKKRQTFVFSATIALSPDFRKKLKRGSLASKHSRNDELSSIESLSERAGMRADAAIFDLTSASIMANKLEESFLECKEEDKDAYLYYILSVHGQGRTIVFCTSIAALRHISAHLRILGVNVWTLHAQMQQRARLKAMDRFRGSANGILIATDVAARGLDIPGVRTVVHYQLPHSADVYVHRSGRTARASADGCSIALISPNDKSKFASLCKSFSKESLKRFPIDSSLIPEITKRLSLARQIDKISRKDSKEKADKTWFQRQAESVELVIEDSDSEEDIVNSSKKRKLSSLQLEKLQEELKALLSRPLQPKSFSHRFWAGSGVSPLLQNQFKQLATNKEGGKNAGENKRSKLVVIGQDCIEPLQALRSGGHEVSMDVKGNGEKRRNVDNARRKKMQEKKRLHDQRRKEKKRLKTNEE